MTIRSIAVALLLASLALSGCSPSAEEKAEARAAAKARAEAKADAALEAAGVAYLKAVKPLNDYGDEMSNQSIDTIEDGRKNCKTWADLHATSMRDLTAYQWPTEKTDSMVDEIVLEMATARDLYLQCAVAESLDEWNSIVEQMDNGGSSVTAELLRLELRLGPVKAKPTPTSTPS